MFEFLKKGLTHSKPVTHTVPRAEPVHKTVPDRKTEPHTQAGEAGTAPVMMDDTGIGIEVQEMGTQLPPEIEQAVMQYAEGRTDEAITVLSRFLFEHPDHPFQQAWHLLFDLYELTGKRQQFEELALDYAVRYERSPPTWREHGSAEIRKTANYPSFAFSASLDEHDARALEQCRKQWDLAEAVLLDFSKITAPSDDYADFILDVLDTIECQDKVIHLAGAEAFVVRLNAAKSGNKLNRPGWLLLLHLLQLQGLVDKFDDVALDYAVTFELSPPSYVAPRHLAVQEMNGAEPEIEEAEPPEPMPDAPFALHGVLNMSSADQFEQLRQSAQPLNQVVVSLADVPRIDFTAVGLVLDTVMTLVSSGKQVEFVGGNGLVNLMLQMTGVGQLATLKYETRK